MKLTWEGACIEIVDLEASSVEGKSVWLSSRLRLARRALEGLPQITVPRVNSLDDSMPSTASEKPYKKDNNNSTFWGKNVHKMFTESQFFICGWLKCNKRFIEYIHWNCWDIIKNLTAASRSTWLSVCPGRARSSPTNRRWAPGGTGWSEPWWWSKRWTWSIWSCWAQSSSGRSPSRWYCTTQTINKNGPIIQVQVLLWL